MVYQLANTNHTSMEHITLSVINVGSKELTISGARLDYILIHINQERSSIDRQGHSNWELSYESQKSYDKRSIDFGQNKNNGIHMNPSITIGIIIP